jgi:hypothetical protein
MQTVDVVFCDEQLPDGSYDDLIHSNHWDRRIPRIAVSTRTGEWELYFEAVRKGAFDVIGLRGTPAMWKWRSFVRCERVANWVPLERLLDKPVLWNHRNLAEGPALVVEGRKFTGRIGAESWNDTFCAPCKSGPIAASFVTTGSTAEKQR